MDSSFGLTGLLAATTYEWRVRNVCTTSPLTTSNYTALAEFTTAATFAKSYNPAIAATNETANWKVVIYPNPAQQKAVLQVSGLNNYAVSISNAEGKVLWQSATVGTSAMTLPVTNLASGIYIVSVKSKTEMKNIRLVIEK